MRDGTRNPDNPGNPRRAVLVALAGGATLAGRAPARAQVLQKGPVLSEQDPQALALGYVSDARRVDRKKFDKYRPGQHCAACQLYQGAPTLAQAPCTVFAGKIVAGPGWCSAFAPR